jgi:hypothetical protein
MHLTNEITYEAWIRPFGANYTGWAVIVGKPTSFALFIYQDYGGHNFIDQVYGGASTMTGWSYPYGSWHHVALTSSPTAQQIYVDGTMVVQAAASPVPTYDWHPLLVGATLDGGFGAGFTGVIDEVRIYSKVRSAQEVIADMKGDCTSVNDPSLVVYYPFNEGAGTVTHDGSINHLDGTLGNPQIGNGASPTWTVSSAPF